MKSNFSDSPNHGASMKVPPKRKGNVYSSVSPAASPTSLNESPSEKEGKFHLLAQSVHDEGLNESPSEKEGKWQRSRRRGCAHQPQ